MKEWKVMIGILFVVLTPLHVIAFESGSTGAHGAFNPTASMAVTLPDDGILNYTTVNIPSGVTITFTRNVADKPVYMLATGDVVINGTINVSGADATASTAGEGGNGGFDGGFGALANLGGGRGQGPGGGQNGLYKSSGYFNGGGGGGYGATGFNSYDGNSGGVVYGNDRIIPLIGGSGGGGGGSNNYSAGGSGGGGGGAILIASSTSIQINGAIHANGGKGVYTGSQSYYGAGGGGGSGGAIKLAANLISGNGTLSAAGGAAGANAGVGGKGRIRLEASSFNRTAASDPPHSIGEPTSPFLPNSPVLTIETINGATPQKRTGSYQNPDMYLPSTASNSVVTISGQHIPVGTTVKLINVPQYGNATSVDAILNGADQSSTTGSATVTFSSTYSNVLYAETTFTPQIAYFIDGEKVERIYVASNLAGEGETVYITESGRRIKADQAASLN